MLGVSTELHGRQEVSNKFYKHNLYLKLSITVLSSILCNLCFKCCVKCSALPWVIATWLHAHIKTNNLFSAFPRRNKYFCRVNYMNEVLHRHLLNLFTRTPVLSDKSGLRPNPSLLLKAAIKVCAIQCSHIKAFKVLLKSLNWQ